MFRTILTRFSLASALGVSFAALMGAAPSDAQAAMAKVEPPPSASKEGVAEVNFAGPFQQHLIQKSFNPALRRDQVFVDENGPSWVEWQAEQKLQNPRLNTNPMIQPIRPGGNVQQLYNTLKR